MELSEDTVGRSNTTTRTAPTRLVSRAKARAKEARAKENVTIAEPPGMCQENARSRTRARAKAMVSNENASIAEKWAIQPASAPRTKELGAGGDT